jgi:uncharacterized membrane protein
MFLNVWLIIWPNQKIALGLVEGGDGPTAAGKALLASRTNTMFSGPMAFFMLAGPHFVSGGGYGAKVDGSMGWIIALLIVAALQVNAIMGKQGPMTTVKGVIHCSMGLTAVLVALLVFL